MRLENKVVAALLDRGMTVSLAESCTGGAVAARLVSVPGVSAAFLGGVVSYTDAVKARLLGVFEDTLAAHTAVSAPVAAEMAEGIRKSTGSDLALSVTGLAGPGGGTVEIPVGRVFVGVATAAGTRVKTLSLSGSRSTIRRKAATAVLREALYEILMTEETISSHKKETEK